VTDPDLIKTLWLIGFFIIFAFVVILAAMYDKSKSRWSYLYWGGCLISIAIFSIVGIELIEAIYKKDGFVDGFSPANQEQLSKFIQVVTVFKWSFVLIAGGIGVNLCSHGIINSKDKLSDTLDQQQLNHIESNTITIKKMIVGLGVFIFVGFIALWMKI